MSTHDNYQTDNVALAQAMANARHAEERAQQAKIEALAEAAKEDAKQREIARAVELSVANNPQLLAQRSGFSPNRLTRSQDVGMIAPPEVVNNTAVRFNGIEISAQQAKDMVEHGQWDRASYQRALSEALALHGYRAPGSFR